MFFILLACAGAAALPAGASTSTNVGVTETEYHVVLGRATVPRGRVTFNIANFGQDDHNLKVARHYIRYGSSGLIRAGARASFTVTLAPGTYHVFCSIPGHRAMGMVATLLVR